MTEKQYGDDYRVCNTADLRLLSSRSTDSHRIPADVNERLDPEGSHVLNLVLWGHNVDNPDNDLHHRVRVLAKLSGTNEPSEPFLLDIRDTDWKRLMTAEQAKANG
jgi:hypothetical protein